MKYLNLPDQYKLNESVKQAKQTIEEVLRRRESLLTNSENSPESIEINLKKHRDILEGKLEELKELLKKNPALIGNFLNYYLQEVPVLHADDPRQNDIGNEHHFSDSLEMMINWIKQNKGTIKSLPKNLIQYRDYEELVDDIRTAQIEAKSKVFYQMLKYLGYTWSEDDILNADGLWPMPQLSKTFGSLPKQKQKEFTDTLKYYKNNKPSLKNFLLIIDEYVNKDTGLAPTLNLIKSFGDKIEVIYNQSNILMVHTNDREAVKKLGSQKWCIVYSDSYFKSYCKNDFNTQYIIFNFNLPSSDPKSLFGVTITTDDTAKYGATQDKSNSEYGIEGISSETGLPLELFKSLKREKRDKYEQIKTELGEIDIKEIFDKLDNIEDDEIAEKLSENLPTNKIAANMVEKGFNYTMESTHYMMDNDRYEVLSKIWSEISTMISSGHESKSFYGETDINSIYDLWNKYRAAGTGSLSDEEEPVDGSYSTLFQLSWGNGHVQNIWHEVTFNIFKNIWLGFLGLPNLTDMVSPVNSKRDFFSLLNSWMEKDPDFFSWFVNSSESTWDELSRTSSHTRYAIDPKMVNKKLIGDGKPRISSKEMDSYRKSYPELFKLLHDNSMMSTILVNMVQLDEFEMTTDQLTNTNFVDFDKFIETLDDVRELLGTDPDRIEEFGTDWFQNFYNRMRDTNKSDMITSIKAEFKTNSWINIVKKYPYLKDFYFAGKRQTTIILYMDTLTHNTDLDIQDNVKSVIVELVDILKWIVDNNKSLSPEKPIKRTDIAKTNIDSIIREMSNLAINSESTYDIIKYIGKLLKQEKILKIGYINHEYIQSVDVVLHLSEQLKFNEWVILFNKYKEELDNEIGSTINDYFVKIHAEYSSDPGFFPFLDKQDDLSIPWGDIMDYDYEKLNNEEFVIDLAKLAKIDDTKDNYLGNHLVVYSLAISDDADKPSPDTSWKSMWIKSIGMKSIEDGTGYGFSAGDQDISNLNNYFEDGDNIPFGDESRFEYYEDVSGWKEIFDDYDSLDRESILAIANNLDAIGFDIGDLPKQYRDADTVVKIDGKFDYQERRKKIEEFLKSIKDDVFKKLMQSVYNILNEDFEHSDNIDQDLYEDAISEIKERMKMSYTRAQESADESEYQDAHLNQLGDLFSRFNDKSFWQWEINGSKGLWLKIDPFWLMDELIDGDYVDFLIAETSESFDINDMIGAYQEMNGLISTIERNWYGTIDKQHFNDEFQDKMGELSWSDLKAEADKHINKKQNESVVKFSDFIYKS